MNIILLIVIVLVVLALVGSLPVWPYSAGWGYRGSGISLGGVIVVLLILWLLGIL